MCLPKTRRLKNYPNYFDLDQYIARGELLTIHDKTDLCSVCGGDFKYTKRYTMTETTPEGLKEVVFKTAHSGCLHIMARIKQKRYKILDLEFQIFCKSADCLPTAF
jgi:hypothetical protein